MGNESGKAVNLGRHERCCKVCSHKNREDIDRMSREELEAYAKDAKLPDWFTQAVGVTGDVEVTASAVVSAIQACAKINAQGQWIDRTEHGPFNDALQARQARGLL